MYFSQEFNIRRKGKDDWFDPILNADTKLFVDPFLIFSEAVPPWSIAHDRLIEHFNICFKLIADGNQNPKSVAYGKALALLRFPEPREFCLGYTERGTRGAGGGLGYARLIGSAMVDAIGRGLRDLRHFEELGVLNEGIGPDRISDLTCNILRSEFISYTREVVARHGLPTRQVHVGGASFDRQRLAWRSETFELPINPTNRRPILLVPARFLRDLPVLNADDWWANYEAEQLRNDLNYEVMGKVSKKVIVSTARRNLISLRAWSKAKESDRVASYDFQKDPLGVWQWLREAQRFAKASPLTITPPADDKAFVEVIKRIIDKYKHFVEQQGGWKLLWNDRPGDEKPEEAAQLLFKGIAQSYCQANNVVIDREVNLGRGPVDFKFSNGYRNRALLEIKKLHNGRFWNNVTEQLPSYLTSDQCSLGWYVIVRYREGGASKKWAAAGPGLINGLARQHSVQLASVTVDARPKQSASKL